MVPSIVAPVFVVFESTYNKLTDLVSTGVMLLLVNRFILGGEEIQGL